MCESPREGVCGATDFLLSKHELAQERLYRLWKAGWVKGQNVMLKDMVMEVMANTAKRLLKKLPTMCLYLPQLISLSRLVLFSVTISSFVLSITKMLLWEDNSKKLNSNVIVWSTSACFFVGNFEFWGTGEIWSWSKYSDLPNIRAADVINSSEHISTHPYTPVHKNTYTFHYKNTPTWWLIFMNFTRFWLIYGFCPKNLGDHRKYIFSSVKENNYY